MLKDKLYSVVSVTGSEGKIIAGIHLNKDDELFKGHFPGQPVLPGACMLQILKEVLELALNKKIRLKKADQMKFLSVVNPAVNGILQLNIGYSINEEQVLINAIMNSKSDTCFKFKGGFIYL